MGNWSSSENWPQISEDRVAQIQTDTGFTSPQVDRLWKRFQELDRGQKNYLTREDFLNLPDLGINPLCDRIIHAFFQDDGDEKDQNKLEFIDFVKVLAHFRPIKKEKEANGRNILNSRSDKLRFAFRMYDIDGDNKISKEEVLEVLLMIVGSNISEKQLRSIAENVIRECGSDDRLIDFGEFCKAMEKIDVETKMTLKY